MNKIVSGASQLFVGSILSQVVSMLIIPLQTRFFSATSFGVNALFISAASMFGILATGKYENAIVLPESDTDAINIFALSMIINTAVSCISSIIFLFIDFTFYHGQFPLCYCFLFFIYVFSCGLASSVVSLETRRKRFISIASFRLYSAILLGLLPIVFSFFMTDEDALTWGIAIASMICSLLFFFLCRLHWGAFSPQLSRKAMTANFRKYSDFPKYNIAQGFLDGLQTTLLYGIIGNFFGSASLGLYTVSQKFTRTPLNMLAGSVSQVVFPEINERKSQRSNIFLFVRKTLIVVSGFASLALFGVVFMARPVLPVLLGAKWAEIVPIVIIYIVPQSFAFVASSLSSIPLVLDAQKENLYISIIGNLMPLVIFGTCGVMGFGFDVALKFFAVLLSVYFCFVVAWYLRVCKRRSHW